MNILINSGLSDKKFRDKIYPLLCMNEIKRIFLIRDKFVTREIDLNNKIVFKKNHSSRFKSFYKFFEAIDVIKDSKIDIIISYFLISHGIRGIICSKLFNKPSIVCILGSDLDIYLKKSILRYFYLYILKKSDIVLARGSKSRNFLVSKGFDSNKVNCIPNYLDTEQYNKKLIPKDIDLITIGRLSSEKNIDLFLRSVSIIDQKLKICIVGAGPARQDLVDLSLRICQNHDIEFTGERDDVSNLINRSKILVLTSKREGLPQVLSESMACGVPAIATNVGDISDLITHNFNGLLTENNESIISTSIRRLLNDEGLYRKLSTNAYKSAREKHNLDNLILRWKHVIKGVING